MPSYRVDFINEIPRNQTLYRCCQRSITIGSARSAHTAVEEAKKKFAELEGISDWKIHASLIEIRPIDPGPVPDSLLPTAVPRLQTGRHAGRGRNTRS